MLQLKMRPIMVSLLKFYIHICLNWSNIKTGNMTNTLTWPISIIKGFVVNIIINININLLPKRVKIVERSPVVRERTCAIYLARALQFILKFNLFYFPFNSSCCRTSSNRKPYYLAASHCAYRRYVFLFHFFFSPSILIFMILCFAYLLNT